MYNFFHSTDSISVIKKIVTVLFFSSWVLQILGIILFGLQAINIISSILFIGLLYFILSTIINSILSKLSISSELQTNILLSIKSTFITFTFLEVILRLLNLNSTYMEERTHHYSSPYNNSSNNWFHTWTNDHNLTTPEYNYSRKVNRDLLSDVNHPIKKEDNEFRIIGLGDSFTEGDGAHKDSTWLKALERIIARNKSQQNHTYMNAGVSGSDVFFEYILLKEKLLKYKPDLVLLALNNSDISDVIIRGGMGRFKSDGTLIFNKAPNWEPIFAVSYLSRFVFKNALKYNDILVKRNSEKYQIARTQIFQALKQIQELALKNNFEFVVVFHPVKDEISKGKLDLADVLSRVKKETQIVNFNLLEYFLDMEGINSSNFDQLYWEHDGHHNALGYEKFANGIEWKMKKMNIIQSDSSN